MVSIDGTILNVALPTISNALHTTSAQLIWINSAYIIILGSTILLGGSLGDKYGRKWFLLLGLLVFVTGSVWAGLSTKAYSLILARGFMGVGGGLIMPATLSLITNIFPDQERAKAIGVWAGMAGIGVAIGPLAGGLLLTWFYWGSVFFVNVPVAAIGVIAVWRLVPNSKSSDSPPLDLVGAAISFVGLLALFFGLIRGPDRGWSDPGVIAAFVLAAVLLVLFVLLELRKSNPLLDVRFFKIPEFASGVISIAIGFFALFGLIYVLTIYIQIVLSYSPMEAGLALLPFALVLLVGSPMVPRLVKWLGGRTVVALGLLVIASGMMVFRFVTTSTTYPLILAGLVLVSAGMAMAQVPSSDAIMGSIPRDRAGEGSATNAAIRQIGSSLGIALIGGISSLGYRVVLSKTSAFQALSGTAAQQAESGLNGALAVSQGMGNSGADLANAAKTAFTRGLDASMILTAVIAFIGAVIAYRFIPRKPTPTAGR
ncbi:MAG: MFS transporter [Actinobacteria bacterium]|nr:MFS transporter [Actinomycetota bacterium]MBU1943167.1 MFS transporter [Actinomycetota bacterium]MBU2687887.1 MFS transporter [Actinomycetota bacterium]